MNGQPIAHGPLWPSALHPRSTMPGCFRHRHVEQRVCALQPCLALAVIATACMHLPGAKRASFKLPCHAHGRELIGCFGQCAHACMRAGKEALLAFAQRPTSTRMQGSHDLGRNQAPDLGRSQAPPAGTQAAAAAAAHAAAPAFNPGPCPEEDIVCSVLGLLLYSDRDVVGRPCMCAWRGSALQAGNIAILHAMACGMAWHGRSGAASGKGMLQRSWWRIAKEPSLPVDWETSSAEKVFHRTHLHARHKDVQHASLHQRARCPGAAGLESLQHPFALWPSCCRCRRAAWRS